MNLVMVYEIRWLNNQMKEIKSNESPLYIFIGIIGYRNILFLFIHCNINLNDLTFVYIPIYFIYD